MLLDLCFCGFPYSGSPHRNPTGKACIHFPFHGPCVKKGTFQLRPFAGNISWFLTEAIRVANPWNEQLWNYNWSKAWDTLCGQGIMVPVPIQISLLLVLYGDFAEKRRQMQLAATFQLSPLESVELSLLWNLIRFFCLTELLLPPYK